MSIIFKCFYNGRRAHVSVLIHLSDAHLTLTDLETREEVLAICIPATDARRLIAEGNICDYMIAKAKFWEASKHYTRLHDID